MGWLMQGLVRGGASVGNRPIHRMHAAGNGPGFGVLAGPRLNEDGEGPGVPPASECRGSGLGTQLTPQAE